MKSVRFNAFAASALNMLSRGFQSCDMVHLSYGQLSSPLPMEQYQRGGYTETCHSLADVANGCLPFEELEIHSCHPRSECPETVNGGFQRDVLVYTVDKAGTAKRVTASQECTYCGDKPSPIIAVPDAPRVVIEFRTSGNGATVTRHYYG